MNLWFRMLGYFLRSWRWPKIEDARLPSTLRFRVWPSDIDFLFHMTNARYLSIADLGRLDFMKRTGLLRIANQRKWIPIVTYSAILFRRELKLWRSFELETRIRYWTDTVSVFEHAIRFRTGPRKGEVAALCLVAASMYSRRDSAFVPSSEITSLLEVEGGSPEPTAEVLAFLEAQAAFKTVGTPVPAAPAQDSDLMKS